MFVSGSVYYIAKRTGVWNARKNYALNAQNTIKL
jgi:hypothetical protein